ncbi:MAG: hypothetical protein IJM62_04820, partial [Lachnospiraceae bacterium]|nr:hypothetical protein [Lachnospiraceae bacterium]
ILSFEESAARLGTNAVTIFRNILPVLAVLLAVLDFIHDHKRLSSLLSPYFIFGAVFAVSGIIGWLMHRYQTLWITMGAMHEHLRFWLCLFLFFKMAEHFSLRKYADRLFIHISLLSVFLLSACIADMIFGIWPRQVYRYGIGSLQIFYGHPSNLGAQCVFLLGMLTLLYPFLRSEEGKATKKSIINIVLTCGLLLMTVMTMRIRLIGFAVIFLIFRFYMTVLRKRLHLPVMLAAAAAALAVGWRRLYDFYFSPYAYTMARGQFTMNSLDIARRNLPFGSGFGTFGSRLAQLYYSPLYYKYDMMITAGMTPAHPAYACDTFFPCILAESGWLGLIAYIGLVMALAISVFLKYRKSDPGAISGYAYFTIFLLLIYELLETAGALSFSETYSVKIAMVIGIALVMTGSARAGS